MKIIKKGFSLVEILGVIVILGILSVLAITAVSRLIAKSKEESDNQNKRTLQMAAESYANSNKSVLPKNIGERTIITATDLYRKKYLKEEIVNSKGENCISNSYIEVHKITKNTYDYNTFLYCGSEGAPSDIVNKPVITDLKFVDANKNQLDDYSNLKNAYISFRIKGGIDGSTNKAIPLESYHFSIAVSNDGTNYIDAYNSGTLSANLLDEVEVIKKVSEFIDITKSTIFKIRVVAINNQGKKIERDITSTDFMDRTSPVCTDASSRGATNWINAKSYIQDNKVRTISLTCSDGDGSGCIRKEFTRTWPNKDQHDVEFGYIKVTDNAGHSNLTNDAYLKNSSICDLPVLKDTCRVRVNVDTTYPKLTINAYKRAANGSKANNTSVFKNTVVKTIGNTSVDPTSEVQYNSYNVGTSANGWLNKAEFPNGIVYEITISDNLHLASWSWQTNAPGYETTGGNYKKVRTGNEGENRSGSFRDINPETENCGTRTANTIYVAFTDEGRRYGEFTVKDKAGNATIYKIQANLDHTNPTCSLGVTGTIGNKGWFKTNNATVKITNKGDTGSSLLTKYGMGTSTTPSYNSKSSDTQGNTNGITWYGYVLDNAGNAGTCQASNIKVDTTNPTCSISLDGVSGSSGWYKTRNVNLSLSKNDTYSGIGSLYGMSKSNTRVYNGHSTDTQGDTPGITWYGFVEDNAGNIGSCRTNGFKVDTVPPSISCSITDDSYYEKDSNNKLQITDTTSDTTSGIASKSYNMTNFSGSKAVRWHELRSQNNQVKYTGSVTAIDKAGNSRTVQCGGKVVTVPATCSRVDYSGWSACSAVCGGGVETRTATSYYNGSRCPASDESRSCNTQDCCSSYHHGGWSNCTASCGGGTQSRLAYSDYNGGRCPGHDETKTCNTQSCSVTMRFCRSQCNDCSWGCDPGTTWSWLTMSFSQYGNVHRTPKAVKVAKQSNGWWKILEGSSRGQYVYPGCLKSSGCCNSWECPN